MCVCLLVVVFVVIQLSAMLQHNNYYVGYASKRMKPVDEGLALGDYPQLPWESAQLRSPRGWWDNQDRRNKEDPVNLLFTTISCLYIHNVYTCRLACRTSLWASLIL